MDVRIEVTVIIARWGADSLFGGYIDFCDDACSALFEFSAQLAAEGEDTICTFSRLCHPACPDEFSDLGPYADETHLLFACAVRLAVAKLADHLGAERGGVPPEGQTFDDLDLTVRIPIEVSSCEEARLLAALINPEGWGAYVRPAAGQFAFEA